MGAAAGHLGSAAAVALLLGLTLLNGVHLATSTGPAFHDSDSLVYPLFYRDVFRDGFPASGFMLPRVTSLFPEVPLLLGLLALGLPLGAAGALYGLGMLGLLLVAVFLVARVLTGSARQAWILAALYGALYTTLVLDGHFWLRLLFLPTFHGGTNVDGLLLLGLGLALVPSGGRGLAAAFAVVAGLGVASDALFLAQYLGPLVVAAGLLAWRGRLPARVARRLGLLALAGTAAAWLGLEAVERLGWLRFQDLAFDQGDPWQLLAESARTFASEGADMARRFPRFAVLVLVSAGVSAGSLAWPPRGDDLRHRLLHLFALLCLGATVLAPVLGGRWSDPFTARYLQPLSILPPLVLLLEGARRFPRLPPPSAALGLAAVVALAALYWGHPGTSPALLTLETPYPDDVRALDVVARARGLRYGFSGFHQANRTTALSREGLQVLHLNPDLSPWHWGNHRDRYRRTPEGGFPPYTFVVTRGLDRDRLLDAFGSPSEVVRLGDLEVFLYPAEEQGRRFREHLERGRWRPD